MASPYAFVTLLTSDHYLPGALALAAALRDVHSSPAVPPEVDFQTVCLVTPETVDVTTIKLLRRAFDVVIGVELIAQESEKGLQLLGRPDLNAVLTKLHVFRLTQYSKIIFLDADVLPIKPLSHLFTTPHEFSAVPDVGWPDIFNSGVLVLSPGKEKFSELRELLKTKGTWDGGDQGILNEWRGGDWNRLSFTYNTTPTAAYTYAPAYERFGSQISAIHFIGPNKPWKSISYRPPFISHQSSADSSQRAYDFDSLVDKWFNVYDKHYRSQAIIPETDFEVQKYVSAWDEQSGTSAEFMASSAKAQTTLSIEDLRRLAIEGISSIGRSPDNRSGEGDYRSMPLEGRVDLMRPQLPPFKELEPEKQVLDDTSAGHRPSGTFESSEVPPSPHPHSIPLPHTDSFSEGYGQQLQAPHPYFQGQLEQSQPEIHTASTPSYRTEYPELRSSQTQSYQHHDDQHQQYQHEHEQINQPQPQYSKQDQQLQPQAYGNYQEEKHARRLQQQHAPAEPPRPSSPPKLLWNPAVEPPPKTAPTPSAFPSDTYFPNVWDQPPSKHHDQTQQNTQEIGFPFFDSSALFQPPPTPQIPESLRKQGHYRNVTGESEDGSAENPDRSKVKPVFPWEGKPRAMPGRVFPAGEVPSPTLFTSPLAAEEETVPSPEPVREVKEIFPSPKTLALPSPTKGLPVNLSYANAWDTVPSIQRYASRLVRPPPPQPLAAAFDSDDYRKSKNWDERTEVSSRDGDDEDNADDDDDSPVISRWTDDSDNETSLSTVSTNKTRSRRGSMVSVSHSAKGKKKEYRVRGVQTTSPELRDQAIQVDPPKVSNTSPSLPDRKGDDQGTIRAKKSSLSLQTGDPKKEWPPSTTSNSPPAVSAGQGNPLSTPQRVKGSAGTRTGVDTGNGRSSPHVTSPDLRSPREFEFPEETKAVRTPKRSTSAATITSAPQKLNVQMVQHSSGSPNFNLDSPASSRQGSNDGSSLASPPSSIGPASPPEGQPVGVMDVVSPPRKVGRVFDPARGVELFKRGSEEVLARFLKMSSWEDVSPQQ